MITEQQEFLISQFVDGSLPGEQRAMVAEQLRGDSQLRDILGEYQKLDLHLAGMPKMPAVDWDRLASHLSSVVEEQSRTPAGRIFPAVRGWQLRAAAAAMVVFAVGGVIWMKSIHRVATAVSPVAQSSDVAGPQAEVAKGPAIEEISVGPSPALAKQSDSWRFADGVVGHGPSKVTITAGPNPAPSNDSHLR